MAYLQNYTLGRGKIFFSRFKANTQTPSGFRYMGNSPEFNLTIETEDLDHFSSDQGIREKDDSVPLDVTRSGSMIVDSITYENIALFFFGSASTIALLAASGLSETFNAVIAGMSYQIGVSEDNPGGLVGINTAGFNVAEAAATLVAATGTVTYAGVGTNGDTVTVGGQTYTMKTVPVDPYDVDIGVDVTTSAANLVAAINGGAGEGTAYGTGTDAHPDVSAANTAGVVTVTALVTGTAGNSIALAEAGAASSVSGAFLSGGTGISYIEGTDYEMDYTSGFLSLISGGAIATGTNIKVLYRILGSSRDQVVSGSTPTEGALKYIENNPKGDNKNWYMPWVKVKPNGDYALKGDEWQQIPLALEFLKPTNGVAIVVDGAPLTS